MPSGTIGVQNGDGWDDEGSSGLGWVLKRGWDFDWKEETVLWNKAAQLMGQVYRVQAVLAFSLCQMVLFITARYQLVCPF